MNFRAIFHKCDTHKEAFCHMKRKLHSCFCLVLLIAVFATGCTQNATAVLSLEEHKIYRGEFLLYCDIAKSKLADRKDEDAVYQSAIEYATEVYALYDLSAELQLSDPFSFSALEEKMQQENESRKEQSQNGQPVMGVLQYELSDYLEYSLSECRYNIALALAKAPTDEITAQARQYYEEHKEDYISDATYQYQVISVIDGKEVSEIKTISYEELTASYHSSDALGDILIQGDIGKEYHVGSEKITVLDRKIVYTDFSDIQQMVIMTFMEKEGLSKYLEEYAESCEVVFDVSQLSD